MLICRVKVFFLLSFWLCVCVCTVAKWHQLATNAHGTSQAGPQKEGRLATGPASSGFLLLEEIIVKLNFSFKKMANTHTHRARFRLKTHTHMEKRKVKKHASKWKLLAESSKIWFLAFKCILKWKDTFFLGTHTQTSQLTNQPPTKRKTTQTKATEKYWNKEFHSYRQRMNAAN